MSKIHFCIFVYHKYLFYININIRALDLRGKGVIFRYDTWREGNILDNNVAAYPFPEQTSNRTTLFVQSVVSLPSPILLLQVHVSFVLGELSFVGGGGNDEVVVVVVELILVMVLVSLLSKSDLILRNKVHTLTYTA